MVEMSKEILFSSALIQKRVKEMAWQISKDYEGRVPLFSWLI